jgi:L-lactate dehydrogenase
MIRHIAIIGAGNVGATTAYTFAASGLAEKLSLIDINEAKAEGEALDLRDGISFLRPVVIRSGGYELCREAQIVIVTAGANQAPGQSRLELLEQNAAVFRQVIPAVVEHDGGAIIIVVTNPVDVLTYLAQKLSGLPPGSVFGSGTVLDTARLRNQISRHCRIDARNVHGYVIGEHGDTAVPVWSAVQIAGMRLEQFCRYCGKGCSAQTKIGEKVRSAAERIISRKGATYYSIALAVKRIVQSILRNEHSVLTVSTLVEDYYGISDVCLSLPAIVSGRGVQEVLPLELAPPEAEALRRSAARLKEAQLRLFSPAGW